MVNVKLKRRKAKYLPGSSDTGRLQDGNLSKTFQEQLNSGLESLKFDNVDDGRNNYRKILLN